MPLESTIICLDTSEFMRNGDFTPTRHESQQDAANLVVGAKMQQRKGYMLKLLWWQAKDKKAKLNSESKRTVTTIKRAKSLTGRVW